MFDASLRIVLGLPADRNHTSIQIRMNSDESEASPTKAVVTELDNLRVELRQAVDSYTARLDSEIERVRAAVQASNSPKGPSSAKIRDLRDMLTLLRHRQTRADKGRRKDLKKFESVVGDLGMLIENW
jgi:hypothetical protein